MFHPSFAPVSPLATDKIQTRAPAPRLTHFERASVRSPRDALLEPGLPLVCSTARTSGRIPSQQQAGMPGRRRRRTTGSKRKTSFAITVSTGSDSDSDLDEYALAVGSPGLADTPVGKLQPLKNKDRRLRRFASEDGTHSTSGLYATSSGGQTLAPPGSPATREASMSRVLDAALTLPPLEPERRTSARRSWRNVLPIMGFRGGRKQKRDKRKLGAASPSSCATMLSTTDGFESDSLTHSRLVNVKQRGDGEEASTQNRELLQQSIDQISTLVAFKAKAASVPVAKQKRFYREEIRETRALVTSMDQRLKVRRRSRMQSVRASEADKQAGRSAVV